MPSNPTKLGVWLTQKGNPIAMRGAQHVSYDAEGNVLKRECIFFGDEKSKFAQHAPFSASAQGEFLKKDEDQIELREQQLGLVDSDKKPDIQKKIEALTRKYSSIEAYVNNHPDQEKEEALWDALWLRYSQNDMLRNELLATANAILVLDTEENLGADGKGENTYGRLLMLMRDEIQKIAKAAEETGDQVDWKKTKKPEPSEKVLDNEQNYWQNFGDQNTPSTFTRTISAATNSITSYDLSQENDKKKKFCSDVLFPRYLQKQFEAMFSDGTYSGTMSIAISTRKDNSLEMSVNGDTTSISFDIKSRSAKEPTKFTLERTYDPETKTVSYEVKSQAKNRNFFTQADLEQEWRYGYALMAASHAGIKEEDANNTNKLLNGMLPTGSESDRAEKKDFTTLRIPDPYEYVSKQTIKVNGEDFTIPCDVTKKQAIGIAAFLERFKVVQFTSSNGNVLSIEAPTPKSQTALRVSEPASTPGIPPEDDSKPTTPRSNP